MAKTITATVRKRISMGGTTYAYFGTLTPDSSYETAGDSIIAPAAPALTLPEKIDYFDIHNAGGYLAEWVPSTGKVKLYVSPAAAKEPAQEVAAAKDISATVFQFVCFGS